MSKKHSHIEMLRIQFKYNRTQVLWLTGMSEEALLNLIYDTGVTWIKMHTGETEAAVRRLLSQPMIWQWWTHEWNLRDDTWALDGLYQIIPEQRKQTYELWHADANRLYSITCMELEQTYAGAVGKMIDDLNRKQSK